MSQDGLKISLRLPCRLVAEEGQATSGPEALWQRALLVLQVLNQMEGHPAREPQTEAGLTRLEAKLDLTLHLLAQTLHPDPPPAPARLSLSATGCMLKGDTTWPPGTELRLALHPSPALPLPLELPCTVTLAASGRLELQWRQMPEAVQEAWEQWLFRQHRRWVQGQRAAR